MHIIAEPPRSYKRRCLKCELIVAGYLPSISCFAGDNIEIYFGDGENDGKYYDTGEAIRIYPDGYVAIYSATSENIKKIEFTWGPSGYPDTDKYEINAGTYNVSTQIWSGDSEGVILTKVGNSPKHLRLEAISVTLG